MKIEIFEQFADQIQLNNTYKKQLVTYLNEREMRGTTLKKVEKINKDIPDLPMKECPNINQRETVIFDNIDYSLL